MDSKDVTFVDVKPSILKEKVFKICDKYLKEKDSDRLSEFIIEAEECDIKSHGIHYFLHSLYPHIKDGNMNKFEKIKRCSYEGSGGVGILALEKLLEDMTKMSERDGSTLFFVKTPGKIGALRQYCERVTEKGNVLVFMKNTASTMGIKETKKPVLGTNPICIGFPESEFIYDCCTSVMATNKLRYAGKIDKNFDHDIGGVGSESTTHPNEILSEGGYLHPFSQNHYWYKSFFLGLVVELFSSMAGGKTSERVGPKKGRRLHSKEGLFGFLINKRAIPHFDNYKKEMELLFEELEEYKIRIPGKRKKKDTIEMFKEDYDELEGLI